MHDCGSAPIYGLVTRAVTQRYELSLYTYVVAEVWAGTQDYIWLVTRDCMHIWQLVDIDFVTNALLFSCARVFLSACVMYI